MAKERRDSKNRLLQKGEYQKDDGRYMYRFTDTDGKVGYVYSWTLTKTDRVPKGKTPGPCLRDLEKNIQEDLHDQIRTRSADQATVNDYFEVYLKQKTRLKPTSRRNYRCNYDHHLRDRIGNRSLSSLRYTDIKQCYKSIVEESGVTMATMGNIDAVLTPILNLAVRDRLIRSNPARGVFSEMKRDANEQPEKRKALTIEQQSAFIDFVYEDKTFGRWKEMFTFLLGTGCRIGEACGLTWDDCDFGKNVIHIRHSLSYYPEEYSGKCIHRILTPKSNAGVRDIPMFGEVKEALKRERSRQMKEGFCAVELDGVTGFVFFSEDGTLFNPRNINNTLYRIIKAYNKKERLEAKKNGRDPLILPDFSLHTLRHTFCTRLCENGMNIKVVQEVMGHSKITMTMDVYNNVTEDFRAEAFRSLDGMIKIS